MGPGAPTWVDAMAARMIDAQAERALVAPSLPPALTPAPAYTAVMTEVTYLAPIEEVHLGFPA